MQITGDITYLIHCLHSIHRGLFCFSEVSTSSLFIFLRENCPCVNMMAGDRNIEPTVVSVQAQLRLRGLSLACRVRVWGKKKGCRDMTEAIA